MATYPQMQSRNHKTRRKTRGGNSKVGSTQVNSSFQCVRLYPRYPPRVNENGSTLFVGTLGTITLN